MRKPFVLTGMVISCLVLGGCCKEDFIIPDYNFIQYAVDVTSLMEGANCSDEEAFSTLGATGDMQSAECWYTHGNGPIHNRWFSFTANSNQYVSIEIQVDDDLGVELGTQRRTFLALWAPDGVTELDCEVFYGDDDYVYLGYGGLIEGETYYFSVDVADSDGAGTFTLCIWDTD